MDQILVEVRKIPLVTRTLIGLILSVTGSTLLGLINPYYILFSTRHITQKLELWRLITPFFYAGSGLQLLFDLFIFYRNSIALEQQMFLGRASDYSWMIIILMAITIVINLPLGSMIFWGPFMTAVAYLWSQINPESLVSMFGLPPFKAAYYPFAMLALDFVRGGQELATQSFTGILAGYAINYLYQVYPTTNRGQKLWFLYPPSFLIRALDGPVQTTGMAGGQRLGSGGNAFDNRRVWGGQAPVRPAGENNPAGAATNARYRWGTGNRLG